MTLVYALTPCRFEHSLLAVVTNTKTIYDHLDYPVPQYLATSDSELLSSDGENNLCSCGMGLANAACDLGILRCSPARGRW